MSKKLDIWTIGDYSYELDACLDNLVIASGDNYLFTNNIMNINLGDKTYSTNRFDSIFYSKNSDLLVLHDSNGELSRNDFEKKIIDSGLNISKFGNDDDNYCDELPSKNIWFCRDKDVLEDALFDSEKIGANWCDFYPKLDGLLTYGDGYNEEVERKLDYPIITGALDFEDKLVFLLNGNVKENDVFKTLYRTGINCVYRNDNDLETVKSKVKVKVKE